MKTSIWYQSKFLLFPLNQLLQLKLKFQFPGIPSPISTEIPIPLVVPPIVGSMDDSNPCLLTNGDNLGLSLVTQPLTGENYQTWSRSMVMALVTKNTATFVNDSIKAVDPSSP